MSAQTVKVNGSIEWVHHRGKSYARSLDMLNVIDDLLVAAKETGHETYALEMFRAALLESLARSHA